MFYLMQLNIDCYVKGKQLQVVAFSQFQNGNSVLTSQTAPQQTDKMEGGGDGGGACQPALFSACTYIVLFSTFQNFLE